VLKKECTTVACAEREVTWKVFFGILSNKWRIFQLPLNVCPDFVVDIVKTCVVLHSFVRERDGCKFEDALTLTGFEDVPN
jgi:hypothetical protein